MNSAGDTRPRSGCCQRSSASAPQDRAAREVDLRLVVQLELVALERAAQLASRAAARARVRCVHLGGEELVALRPDCLARYIAASALRSSASASSPSAGNSGDADARGDEGLLAVQRHRLRQALEHLLRHQRRVLGARQVGEHHGELVAADARHGVAAAHRALQALRDLAQQRVARGVAEPVVHQLEVVQVDEQHAERRVAARALDQLREAVGEQRAVGQPGERIELREVGEPALDVDALQRRWTAGSTAVRRKPSSSAQ